MKAFVGETCDPGEAESSVGIVAFANRLAGFQGILKQRYSDFVVREVSKDGTVCRLQNMSGQELEGRVFAAQMAQQAQDREAPNVDALISELQGVAGVSISEADLGSLTEFLMQCVEESEDCPSEFLSALECNDKAVRTSLHQLFRKHASKVVETDTVKNGTSSFIRVIAKKKRGAGGGGGPCAPRRRASSVWPAGTPDYLQFTLCKENVDTMNAASFINKLLHIGPTSGGVEYAGTKDKRAVTAQKCTLYRKRPSELARINKMFTPYLLRVGDFQYVSQPSSLGDLGGNRFSIVLRSLDQPEEHVAAACEGLAQSGFINYYGLQRFGHGKGRSHEIGRALFRGEMQVACELMFHPRVGERQDMLQVKELFAAGKYREAAKLAPVQMHSERAVLEGLAARPGDYGAAFARVPKLTRLICAHAYQSMLWNLAASLRIKRYGYECVEGDLVAVNPSALEAENVEADGDGDGNGETGMGGGEAEAEIDADGEAEDGGVKLSWKPTAVDGNSFQSAKNKLAGAIRVLTAADVTEGRYTLRDVVLPICGADSLLPTNEIGQFYTDSLAKDGLSLATFKTCTPVYRMSGAYRRLMQMPVDFSWRILRYGEPNADLALTELTGVRGQPTKVSGEEGPLRAVMLEFTLPPGTYATMLLRELTKESTETQFQAQLTAAAAASGGTSNEESSAKKRRVEDGFDKQ